MQTAVQRVLDLGQAGVTQLPPHSQLPRLDLGITWESPWQEFTGTLRAFFTGPRAPREGEARPNPYLRVEWVRGKFAGGAFFASVLWHVATLMILLLPIWGFLRAEPPNLAPVRIELTWYAPAQDLPPITLPGPPKKPSPPGNPAKPLAKRGADAFHPRQTILSNPLRITHPRQTLIQPDAPMAPPKIEPQLPNIVEWAAASPRPKVQLPITPSAAAPRIKDRTVRETMPELGKVERNPGPLNIAAAPVNSPHPLMPMSPMSAAVAQPRQRRVNEGAAPEFGPAAAPGDASLHRLIALSATPGPPAPEVNVPQGNLAARIAISPEGGQPGVPGGSANGSAGNGGIGGNASSMGGTNGAGGTTGVNGGGGGNGGSGSLPVGVSVSGGSSGRSSAGGISSGSGGLAPKVILKPMAPLSAAHDLPGSSHRGPADVAGFDPSLPPDKLLSGKEIFTLHVNMPNLTSVTGSWLLNCAQLDEGDPPAYKPKGTLSGPVPLEKADPKYPQSLIKEHVEGEVILYAIIRKDGSVDSIQRVRGLDPQLDKNSMEALARWKFRPGTRDGQPVDMEAVVHIPFHYRISPDY